MLRELNRGGTLGKRYWAGASKDYDRQSDFPKKGLLVEQVWGG
jgi:hypothetical protein